MKLGYLPKQEYTGIAYAISHIRTSVANHTQSVYRETIELIDLLGIRGIRAMHNDALLDCVIQYNTIQNL